LQEVKKIAKEEIQKRYQKLSPQELEKRAKTIALAAIKFMMLKIDLVKDIYYNPQESISFEGETGPYVMYAYARCKSILRKHAFSNQANYSMLKKDKEIELIKQLSLYPKIIKDSQKIKSLHRLCHYLLDLAKKFNEFYQECNVLKSESNIMQARLGLVNATATVLKNGLNMLGIEALEQM